MNKPVVTMPTTDRAACHRSSSLLKKPRFGMEEIASRGEVR